MCQHCLWEDAAEEIERMVDNARYRFARQTLNSLYWGINQQKHVTDRQRVAIKNIRDAEHDPARGGGSPGPRADQRRRSPVKRRHRPAGGAPVPRG